MKSCDEGRDEDQYLESVGGEAHGAVRVKRAWPGAEDVGADQIDLDEDCEDDRQRQRDVEPRRAAPYTGGRVRVVAPRLWASSIGAVTSSAPATYETACGLT